MRSRVCFALAFLLVVAADVAYAQQPCSSGCGMKQYNPPKPNHGLQSFKWSLESVNANAQPYQVEIQNAIQAAGEAWNGQFSQRGSSIRVQPEYPTTTTTVKIYVTTLDTPGQAEVGADGKEIWLDYRAFTPPADPNFAKSLVIHEFGHKFGFSQSCGSGSMMSDTTLASFKPTFTSCDRQELNNLVGGPVGGPECEGDCGGTECGDLFSDVCGPGGPNTPPAPGPTCSISGEFIGATSWSDCIELVCTSFVSDSFNFCTGMWRTEMCGYRWEIEGCGDDDFSLWAGAGGGGSSPVAMQPHSAVRQCSGLDTWSPIYKRTSNECLSYCAANGADACEWAAGNGDCYVEFGSGCQVEYGYSGWSAYVLNGGGGGSGGSGGSSMAQHSAVRGCSDYSELGAVYKSSAEECSSHCQANNADACEWHEGSGDCYVEFGNGCYVEGGYGGWWAAVYGDEAATGQWTIGRFIDGLQRGIRSLDPRSLVMLIVAVSMLLALGLVGLYRKELKRPSGAIA